MTSQFFVRSAVCAAALFSAPAALADVTAAEVWDSWKANLTLYGQDGITIGDEVAEGGTLTVSSLALAIDDEDASVTAEFGPLVFTEQGDGTVAVTMPDSYPIMINDTSGGAEIDLLVKQENMSIVVSGEPDAMNYDVSADSYEVSVADIRGDEDVEGDMLIKAQGLTGSYQTDISAGLDTTFAFTTAAIDLLVDVKEPGGEGYVVFSGKMADVRSDGQIKLPEGADLSDPETFATDFTFQSDTAFGQTGFIFDFDADGDAASGSFEAGSMAFGGSMTPDVIDYSTSMSDAAVTVTAADFPIPVNVSLTSVENVFTMPVSAGEEPSPFGYRMALTDLVVNDEIWSMGDPTGALPRDPASIVLDVSGMAKLFFDLMDPQQQEALEFAEVPGELISVAINDILVSAVGAEVKASGDFTFDNSDLETFDGLPRPMGELNIGITGANALLDTLVSMGLLPQEQATMGRMMMGMFTQPAGDDALTSQITINEDGHVLANGQRLR
ncbi:MAG: DUF2125 domain-containing protein [Pseudomonadota bacterium]